MRGVYMTMSQKKPVGVVNRVLSQSGQPVSRTLFLNEGLLIAVSLRSVGMGPAGSRYVPLCEVEVVRCCGDAEGPGSRHMKLDVSHIASKYGSG